MAIAVIALLAARIQGNSLLDIYRDLSHRRQVHILLLLRPFRVLDCDRRESCCVS